jgi:hypothetical protein
VRFVLGLASLGRYGPGSVIGRIVVHPGRLLLGPAWPLGPKCSAGRPGPAAFLPGPLQCHPHLRPESRGSIFLPRLGEENHLVNFPPLHIERKREHQGRVENDQDRQKKYKKINESHRLPFAICEQRSSGAPWQRPGTGVRIPRFERHWSGKSRESNRSFRAPQNDVTRSCTKNRNNAKQT